MLSTLNYGCELLIGLRAFIGDDKGLLRTEPNRTKLSGCMTRIIDVKSFLYVFLFYVFNVFLFSQRRRLWQWLWRRLD